jgi:hypothetical protein
MGYMTNTTTGPIAQVRAMSNKGLAVMLDWIAADLLRENRPTDAAMLLEAAERLAK